MCDWNSKESIRKWAEKVVNDPSANIRDSERRMLLAMAERMIAAGRLRGDISELWKRAGFGSDKLYDLYL